MDFFNYAEYYRKLYPQRGTIYSKNMYRHLKKEYLKNDDVAVLMSDTCGMFISIEKEIIYCKIVMLDTEHFDWTERHYYVVNETRKDGSGMFLASLNAILEKVLLCGKKIEFLPTRQDLSAWIKYRCISRIHQNLILGDPDVIPLIYLRQQLESKKMIPEHWLNNFEAIFKKEVLKNA